MRGMDIFKSRGKGMFSSTVNFLKNWLCAFFGAPPPPKEGSQPFSPGSPQSEIVENGRIGRKWSEMIENGRNFEVFHKTV